MRTAILSSVVVLSLAAAVAEDKETATVQGKVSFKGQPLAGGEITFHPKQGKAVKVAIADDGTYSVKDLPVGATVITVESFRELRKDKEKRKFNVLPAKYADPKKSGLTYVVKAGKQEYDVDLRD